MIRHIPWSLLTPAWIAVLYWLPIHWVLGAAVKGPRTSVDQRKYDAHMAIRLLEYRLNPAAEDEATIALGFALGLYEVAARVRAEPGTHPGEAAFSALQNRDIGWAEMAKPDRGVVAASAFPRSMTGCDVAVLPDGRWLFCRALGWSLHTPCSALKAVIAAAGA